MQMHQSQTRSKLNYSTHKNIRKSKAGETINEGKYTGVNAKVPRAYNPETAKK